MMSSSSKQGRLGSVSRIIERIEDELLGIANDAANQPGWLGPASKRLESLLAFEDRRDEFKDWLKLAAPADSNDRLSTPVRSWLKSNGYDDIETRGHAVQRLLNLLDGNGLDTEACGLAIILGLQYVVLQYLPGLREFQGSFLQSNLLPDNKLKAICESLRVPHKRGSVNWMSSISQGEPQGFAVITLHDAALDLRGRVAAEDLVCGNRSVSGFAVREPLTTSKMSGYFFVSHPFPGLFVDETRASSAFEDSFGSICKERAGSLARAIESDLLSAFGQEFLFRSREWDQKNPEPAVPPIMSLSSVSPTGFLAALRARPHIDPVGGLDPEWALDCQINEAPFINSIWSRLQLIGYFFNEWADRISLHLQSFADLFRSDNGQGDVPRLAWVPQYRSGSAEEAYAFEHLDAYYPEGALDDLNHWMSSIGQGRWLAWHFRMMRKAEADEGVLKTPLHMRLNSALSIYSGPEAGFSDLVAPIRGHVGGTVRNQVVGFIRFNCAPGFTGNWARFPVAKHDLDKYRQLYRIVQRRLPNLERGVGAILAWTDSELRRLIDGNEPRIRTYKQATDAERVLSDWIVRCLTSILPGNTPPSFEIVKYVFEHLFERLNVDASRLSDLKESLNRIPMDFEELRADLFSSLSNLPEIPVVTFWLQTSRPIIKIVDPSAETFNSLAELLERDPELPQLFSYLSYLSYIKAWRPEEFKDSSGVGIVQRRRIGIRRDVVESSLLEILADNPAFGDFKYVLDFGVPPHGAGLKRLSIMKIETVALGEEQLTLQWQVDSSDVKEIKLKWSWGDQDQRLQSHPFPAAVRYVQGKVSNRVGSVIGKGVKVRISNELRDQEEQGMVAIRDAFAPVGKAFAEHVRTLEEVMLDDLFTDNNRESWRGVSAAREGHLLLLVPPTDRNPLIESFRDVALAYERGAYLAWVLGEEYYQREMMTVQLAAVGHGYTGPMSHLRHEIGLTKLRWDSKEDIDRADVLNSMKGFLHQSSAIIRLGEAAIAFARLDVAQPEPSLLDGREIVTEIRQIIAAYQSENKGVISLEFSDEWQLSGFRAQLVHLLFTHGFSKLVDNAVKAAKSKTSSDAQQVIVIVRPEGNLSHLAVEIKNTGYPLEEEEFEQIRQGLMLGVAEPFRKDKLKPPLGLREAWKCFDRMGVEVEVRKGDAPFVISVILTFRSYR